MIRNLDFPLKCKKTFIWLSVHVVLMKFLFLCRDCGSFEASSKVPNKLILSSCPIRLKWLQSYKLIIIFKQDNVKTFGFCWLTKAGWIFYGFISTLLRNFCWLFLPVIYGWIRSIAVDPFRVLLENVN